MTTYHEATAQLPADATWSCSFGNPGEGGYKEYHRTPAGDRFVITNGRWDTPSYAFDWQCHKES